MPLDACISLNGTVAQERSTELTSVRSIHKCLHKLVDSRLLRLCDWPSDVYERKTLSLLPPSKHRHLEMTLLDLRPNDMAKWRDNLGPFGW